MKQLLFVFALFSTYLLGTAFYTPLNEEEISIRRSVIRFLINEQYIVEDFIYQWERLLRRMIVTDQESDQKLINEATIWKALRKYQQDNNLWPTGVIDARILKKVFGNKYSGMQIIDGGGLYGDYATMKTYGEDDPNIGKAPKFMESTPEPMIDRTKRNRRSAKVMLFDKNDDAEKKSPIFIRNILTHTQL